MKTQNYILITGAAQRLGRAVALSLADAGWNIVIHYHRSGKEARRLAAQIEKKKVRAISVQADLSDADAVAHIIPDLTAKKILLDGLINNAAIFEKDNLSSVDVLSFQEHMQINMFAPLQLIRDFARQHKGKNRNIINITDGMRGWSMSPTFLSYTLSKQCLNEATQMLAAELAPLIRINAVAPGPTLAGKQDDANTFAKLKKILPLREVSSPEEVCDAIQYLLNARSVTGQIITLSGGLQAHRFYPVQQA